ncbi:LD-carboxypeptidase [bacterium]|nr:LD-carboxypeptidase [bacterium]
MTWTRPPALQSGDRVALVSPAGPLQSEDELQKCIAAIENLGFEVECGAHVRGRIDYLAGSDDERGGDLQQAFDSPDIRGIFCVRGGYGSGRLLSKLDFSVLQKQPKIFAGFSDLTSLHGALGRKARMATLHTPTIATALVNEPLDERSRDLMVRILTSPEPVGSLADAMEWREPWVIRGGHAEGTLIGGNLTVFTTLLGTPYIPSPEGKILFLEDVGEEPYRLDRAINHLVQSGYLSRVRGIVLGQFTNCESEHATRDKPEVVLERCLAPLGIPVLGGVPCGHGRPCASLPFGCRVVMEATRGDLLLKEALVTSP